MASHDHAPLPSAHARAPRTRADCRPAFDDLDPNDFCAPGADTVVLEREKQAEVADVAKVVLEHLSARQLDVAALHARGFRRREIAERTQLSPRAVKRLMEQILTIGRAELAELAGHGCETGNEQVAR